MPTKTIHDANQINTPAVGDEFPIWQVSSSAQKRITVADVTAYLESALDLSGDYLLRDGSVAMLAALDMGGFAITNVGNVDGVDVSAFKTAYDSHVANTSNPHSVTAAQVGAVKHDGSVALTGNWDIGASRKIQAERIEARSNAGLKLYEDGGLGIFIEDNTGDVGIQQNSPQAKLHIGGAAPTIPSFISSLNVITSGGIYMAANASVDEYAFAVRGDDNAGSKVHLAFLGDGSTRYASVTGIVNVQGTSGYLAFETAAVADTLVEHVRLTSAGLLGVGIATPDSKAHIWKASAGTIAANANTVLTVESAGDTTLTLLAPAASTSYVGFGDPTGGALIGWFGYSHGSDAIFLGANGAHRIIINSAGRTEPGADGTQDFGSGGARWKDIYATNATIQTSDERDKVNVQPSDLGLDFIRALNPVSWVWADRDEAQITETKTVKRQKKQKVMRTETVIETAGNGKRVRKTIEREVDELVFESIPLFHPNGKPFMEEKRTTVIDSETGEPVEVVERVQAVEQVPVYEEVEVVEVVHQAVKLAHRRPHYGLVAQQVKRAMDTVGVSDFAGYIYNEESDAYGLRYNEFTAPIIAAIQQLADRMDLAGI